MSSGIGGRMGNGRVITPSTSASTSSSTSIASRISNGNEEIETSDGLLTDIDLSNDTTGNNSNNNTNRSISTSTTATGRTLLPIPIPLSLPSFVRGRRHRGQGQRANYNRIESNDGNTANAHANSESDGIWNGDNHDDDEEDDNLTEADREVANDNEDDDDADGHEPTERSHRHGGGNRRRNTNITTTVTQQLARARGRFTGAVSPTTNTEYERIQLTSHLSRDSTTTTSTTNPATTAAATSADQLPETNSVTSSRRQQLTASSSSNISTRDATPATTQSQTTTSSTTKPTTISNPLAVESDTDDTVVNTNTITVTILDFMHQKFQVTVPIDGTVLDLKRSGHQIHKVPVSRQRLIYQGKLLADESSLASSKITASGITIHLFPKPRVVVVDNNNPHSQKSTTTNANPTNTTTSSDGTTNDSENDNNNTTDNNNNNNTNGSRGARIPTIVMNADEAERRSQILVLGSPDYLEAQNNVKLFSFMLLIISSIEILNVLAIALNIPENQQQQNGQYPPASPTTIQPDDAQWTNNLDDDITFNLPSNDYDHNTNNSSNTYFNNNNYTDTYAIFRNITNQEQEDIINLYKTWSWLSWFDFLISVIGVYVAMLGIRATNDNQLRVAKQYLHGTCITAIGWLLYNYIMSLKADEIVAHGEELKSHYNLSSSNGDNPYYNDDWSVNAYNNQNHNDSYGGNHEADESIYSQALQVMLLPAMVWIVCILRAYQFSSLLQEAEIEAENRIREELRLAIDDDEDDDDDGIVDNSSLSSANNNNNNRTQQGTIVSNNDTTTIDVEAAFTANGNQQRRRQQQQQFLPSFLINQSSLRRTLPSDPVRETELTTVTTTATPSRTVIV